MVGTGVLEQAWARGCASRVAQPAAHGARREAWHMARRWPPRGRSRGRASPADIRRAGREAGRGIGARGASRVGQTLVLQRGTWPRSPHRTRTRFRVEHICRAQILPPPRGLQGERRQEGQRAHRRHADGRRDRATLVRVVSARVVSVSVASVRRVRIVAASGRRRGRSRRRALPAGRERTAGEGRLRASAPGQPQATFRHGGGSNVGDRHLWRCVRARTAGRLERAWAGSARSGGSAAPAAVRGRAPSTACWCRLVVSVSARAQSQVDEIIEAGLRTHIIAQGE